jgi:cobalt-zinc-cadmium efflux system outer membrane protein
MARARRDAGDASELEVQLAEVFAGQQASRAAMDSLEVTSRLLDLQGVMGLESDGVVIALSDSLGLPTAGSVPAVGGPTLLVSAAQHALRGADLAVSLERGSIWQPPSVVAGFENRDPAGDAKGLLPLIGISLPLPLLNRNRGGIAFAEAERERARAQLTLARVESTVEIARARREHTAAAARLGRDEALLASAGRVATMSITAYREGAATLAAVLEAQRTARDVMQQYLDDLAAAWIALARLRTLSLTVSP